MSKKLSLKKRNNNNYLLQLFQEVLLNNMSMDLRNHWLEFLQYIIFEKKRGSSFIIKKINKNLIYRIERIEYIKYNTIL